MSDQVTIVVREPDTLAVSIAVIEPPTVVVPITVLSGAKGDKGDPGQDGIIGADGADGPPGADGAQGPAGPAPSGTGIVSVLDGVLQTPATVASFIAADPEGAFIALGLGGAAALNVGTSNNTVAAGDDSRLSDSRTPTAHAASHASGGSDPVTLATSQITGLDSALSGKEPSLPTGDDSALLRDGAGAWILKTLAQFKAWLGLGSAAYENTGAFDSAGAASAAQAAAVQRANHTGTQLMSTISNAGTLATQNGTFSGTHSGTSSGTNTGDQTSVSGNAGTATALQTARAINGVSFDGTAAITVTAAAGTLTGATLASNVLASSLTSVGTLATLTVTATISGSVNGNAETVTTNANLTGPVTSVGNATTITDAAVTLAKMANLAQDTLIGRQTASTGVPEAISCTAAGRSVIAGASASAQRTTLGVVQGTLSIYVGAAEMIPRTTTGCGVNSVESSTNKVNFDALEFDAATAEYAQFLRVMPTNWDGGTVTAKFHWTAASGSGDVVFGLQARCFADTNAIDQAFGTAQTATDTLTSSGLGISTATNAITIAGSPAAGRPVAFQLYRDATAGSDTLAVDAQLLGVEITYTATA